MDKKSYFETAFVHFILKKQYEKKINYVVVKTGHTDYSLKISDRHAPKKIDPVPEYSLEELEELVRRAYYYNYNNPVHNEIVKYWESEKGVPNMTIISSLLEFYPSCFGFDLEMYAENSRDNSILEFVSGHNMGQDIDSEVDFWSGQFSCKDYFMEHDNAENYALFMSFVNQAKEIMISTIKEVCDIFEKRGSPFWKVDLVSLNECAEHFGIHHREKRERSKDMDIFDACKIYAHALHEKKDITDKVSIDKFIKAVKLFKNASPEILFNNLALIRPEHVPSLRELTDLSFEETNDYENNRKTVAVNFIRNAFLCGYSENEISYYMIDQPFFSRLVQSYFRHSKPYQPNPFSLSELISLEKVKLEKEFSDLFRKKYDISFDENGSLCVFCPYNIYEEKVEKMKKKGYKMIIMDKKQLTLSGFYDLMHVHIREDTVLTVEPGKSGDIEGLSGPEFLHIRENVHFDLKKATGVGYLEIADNCVVDLGEANNVAYITIGRNSILNAKDVTIFDTGSLYIQEGTSVTLGKLSNPKGFDYDGKFVEIEKGGKLVIGDKVYEGPLKKEFTHFLQKGSVKKESKVNKADKASSVYKRLCETCKTPVKKGRSR